MPAGAVTDGRRWVLVPTRSSQPLDPFLETAMRIRTCLPVVALLGAALLLPSAAADDLVCADVTAGGEPVSDTCEPGETGICATPVTATVPPGPTSVRACVANP